LYYRKAATMWGHLRVSPGQSAGNEVQSPDEEGSNHRNDKDGERQEPQQLGIVSSDDEDMLGLLDDKMVDLLSDHPREASMMDEEDEMGDYVPASLASFVQKAQSTMETGRQNFLDDANEVIMTSFESQDSTPRRGQQHVLTEDDSDRKLKGDVLGSIERRRIERQRHDEVLVATEDQKAEIHPDFWSPELKRLVPPNPVATMTDSEAKREATAEMITPVKAARVPPPLASPPPATSPLPEESAIMDLVSSIHLASIHLDDPEMEIEFDEEEESEIEMEFEQEEEMESDIDSDVTEKSPVTSQTSPIMEEDSSSLPLQPTSARPTLTTSPAPLPQSPTLAEVLATPTLVELLDKPTPERSVKPQPPILAETLDQPTPERSVKPQPPTPDGSQVSYIGDIDETRMTSSDMPTPSPLSMSSPTTAKRLQLTKESSPPNPPSPVSSMSSSPEPPTVKSTTQPPQRPTVVTTTTATVQPKSPTGRGQSIRRTLEMNKKLVAKKNTPVLSVSTRTAANRQATSKRVSQGTAASRASSTSRSTTNRRVSQGTAASRTSRTATASQSKTKTPERGTTASQTRAAASPLTQTSAATKAVTVASTMSAEDARARARERVRERLLKEKAKMPVVVPKKCSVDDRVARAQERARQIQLEKEAALQTTIRKRTKSVTATRTAAKKVPSISTTARPSGRAHVTVPKTPNFATTAKLGAPKIAPAFPVSMANSTEVLKKGLRGDYSVSTPQSKFSFPRAPHFATTKRHGEKVMTPGGGDGNATLAQSGGNFLNGLRKSMRMLSPSKKHQHNGLTIPKGPKFQPASKRALPQSMAEKEAEEMEYYKSHPFKAAPIMAKEPPPKPVSKPVNRRLTIPKPFSLRSDVRAGKTPPVSTDNRESEEVKEMKEFKFQARPMPSFSQPTKLPEARVKPSAKTVTQPKPFQLSSGSRVTRTSTHAEEEEPKQGFHARPVPKSTYQYQPQARIKSPPTSPKAHAPTLFTSTRTERRKAAEEASHRRTKALALEREKKLKDRQREKLQEALKKADLLTPRLKKTTLVEPFQLNSDVRHEKYQKELEEKLQQEEAERLHQMDFHARPLKPSPPPLEKVHCSKSPTQPEPFHMPGMDLFEAHQQEKERKRVEMEEEEKRLHSFKARPVPKTTYLSPPAKSEKGATGEETSP
jgi:hypothetical protein